MHNKGNDSFLKPLKCNKSEDVEAHYSPNNSGAEALRKLEFRESEAHLSNIVRLSQKRYKGRFFMQWDRDH